MELRCYSYDGGAPPMDSWPQEEKMGVVKQAALQGFDQSYQASMAGLHWARTMCWFGLVQHLTIVYRVSASLRLVLVMPIC